MSLSYEKSNIWDNLDEKSYDQVMEYSSRYIEFLDKAQTERRAAKEVIEMAKANGFKSLDEIKESGSLNKGDKVYLNWMEKSVVLAVIGDDITKGMKIIGAHTDSPRLDVKPNPVYEPKAGTGASSNLAYMKTHYYGGIKKYQWPTLPLALVGVAFTKAGEKVEINIGLDDNDPVFYVPDLLAHLSQDQMKRTLAEGIKGEELNAIIGHSSFGADKESKDKVKDNFLKIINEKYGLIEEDFQISELKFIPAIKAKEVGLDRGLIAAYGHDDKVCSFAILEAILKVENPEITSVALFADKEEIGSVGATGMEGYYLENFIAELISINNSDAMFKTRMALQNSKVLSADVTSALDPTFPDVLDHNNVAILGCGVTITKYVGSRGKGGTNDANSEYLAEIRRIFDDAEVIWQTGEFGKVDCGGAGTISYILAKYGADVVDCGTAMLSMHAPYELLSKADAYMTYKAYDAFYKA